jgi:hypothetical protein
MTKVQSEAIREDVVRQLEQSPVEVLEMALRIVEAREAREKNTRTGT